MESNGSKNFKMLPLLQIANILKLVLNFPPNCPHKTTFGLSEFYRFFFRKSKFTIIAYGEIRNHTKGYLRPFDVQGNLRSFGALGIFRNLDLMIRYKRKTFEWL